MHAKTAIGYAATFVAGGLLVGGAFVAGTLFSPVTLVSPQPQALELTSAPSKPSSQGEPTVPPEANELTSDPAPSQPRGLTSIGDLQRNSMVTVAGTVSRIADEDEFILSDDSGQVQVFTGRSFFAASQGEQVVVKGFVDDGPLLEIYAQEIIREDGAVVSVRGSY